MQKVELRFCALNDATCSFKVSQTLRSRPFLQLFVFIGSSEGSTTITHSWICYYFASIEFFFLSFSFFLAWRKSARTPGHFWRWGGGEWWRGNAGLQPTKASTMTDSTAIERGPGTCASDTSGSSRAQKARLRSRHTRQSGSPTGLPGGPEVLIYQHLTLTPTGGNGGPGAPCPSVPAASAAPLPVDPLGVGAPHRRSFRCLLPKHNLLTEGGPPPSLARQQCRENRLWRKIPPDFRDEIAAQPRPRRAEL